LIALHDFYPRFRWIIVAIGENTSIERRLPKVFSGGIARPPGRMWLPDGRLGDLW
jgi:hypothetical protein